MCYNNIIQLSIDIFKEGKIMDNKLRIRTDGNKTIMRFLPDQADMLSDRSFVSPIHYTRGIIMDDKTVDWLYVGKKGYNFIMPKVIIEEAQRLMKKYNAPVLMNLHLRDGKHSKYLFKHAMIISARPKTDADDHKPLIDDETFMRFTYKPFEKKRSIICTMFPAPQPYLDRLLDVTKTN